MQSHGQGYVVSRHARLRLQQRGISREKLEFVLSHGEEYTAGSGSKALWLNRNACRRSGYRGESNLAIVLSEYNEVIIIMHCIRVSRHWKRSA